MNCHNLRCLRRFFKTWELEESEEEEDGFSEDEEEEESSSRFFLICFVLRPSLDTPTGLVYFLMAEATGAKVCNLN